MMLHRYQARYYEALRRGMAYTPPPARYPRLSAWARRAAWLADVAISAADFHGLDRDARKALVLHLDKRDISMETILAAVRYHATSEYPLLLADSDRHNITAFYALNLNDRYLILRLTQSDAIPAGPVRDALVTLRTHLDQVPAEAG